MRQILVAVLVGAVLGALAMKKIFKPGVELQTVIKDRIVTRTIETKKPDGSVVTETEKTEDHSKVATKTVAKPHWNVSVGAGVEQFDITKPIYKLEVSRRILGDISVGAYATTDQTLGVSLGIGF